MNGSGTYINFKCERQFFNTLRSGLKGNYNFKSLIKILKEELGFVYSGIIKQNKATITIAYTDRENNSGTEIVEALEPQWKKYFGIGKGEANCDLGAGNVKLIYEFGCISNNNENYKYYKKNMSSSGVEIRLNGRLIEYNLFKEIWGIEKHNKYNYLLIRIDLISEDQNKLPMTRATKNGLRQGDIRLNKVYSFILEHLPEVTGEIDSDGIDDEVDLFVELERIKQQQLDDPKTITREQKVFKAIHEKVRIDLYIKNQDNVIIYEGKKDKTTPKDVYQLKMYWDGCIADGITPTIGRLISRSHPESVGLLVEYVNQMKDIQGNNYNFQVKTWREDSVRYPEFNE